MSLHYILLSAFKAFILGNSHTIISAFPDLRNQKVSRKSQMEVQGLLPGKFVREEFCQVKQCPRGLVFAVKFTKMRIYL